VKKLTTLLIILCSVLTNANADFLGDLNKASQAIKGLSDALESASKQNKISNNNDNTPSPSSGTTNETTQTASTKNICDAPPTIARKTICENKELQELDTTLDAAYMARAKESRSGEEMIEVKQQQAEWRKTTRDPCESNVQCLKKTMEQRISVLRKGFKDVQTREKQKAEQKKINELYLNTLLKSGWTVGGLPCRKLRMEYSYEFGRLFVNNGEVQRPNIRPQVAIEQVANGNIKINTRFSQYTTDTIVINWIDENSMIETRFENGKKVESGKSERCK
jgi:hypothetical protein